MSKRFQDFVSFAVMATLIFIAISLRITLISGSSGAHIRYYHFPWIVLCQDAWNTSVSYIYAGTLVAMIALSLCLTWGLTWVLKLLRQKKSDIAWFLFILVIVLYVLAAANPDFVLT